MAAQGKSNHIPALDGIRGIAIAMVVLHHYFNAKLLWMGVDLFFILSGFLVTGILLREKAKPFGAYLGRFYLRRLQRIFPSYLVVLGLCAIFFGTWWLAYWYFYLGGMNFLLVRSLPRIYTLPLWSLAVEEQFYFLWPIAVYFCSNTTLKRLCCGLIVLAPILRFVCTPFLHSRWAVYSMLPFRMDCLACGALLALMWPQLREKFVSAQFRRTMNASAACLTVLASGCLLVLARLGLNTINSTPVSNLLIYLCSMACMLCLFLVALSGQFQSLFRLRIFSGIATVSYTVYLVHFPILILAREHWHLPWPHLTAILITAAYAVVSWYALERPILHLGRRDAPILKAVYSPPKF